MILEAIAAAGYEPGKDVAIALDPASSELYDKKLDRYVLPKDGRSLTSEEMAAHWAGWARSSRSSASKTAWRRTTGAGWALLSQRIGDRVQLVGDDLFVTNTKRIERGILERSANSVLIKVNQIGTLTETLEAVAMASSAGWTCVMSHRSGETEDATIADLAVATVAARRSSARPPAPTAPRSTTSSSASRKSWAAPPTTPAGAR